MEGRGGGSARISAARPQFHPFQPVRPRRFPDAWVPPANAANSTASRPPDSVICRRDTVDTKPALVTPSSSPSPPINTSNFQPRVTPMNPIFFRFDKSRKEREIYLIISLQGLIRRIHHWGQDESVIPFDLSETSLLPLLLENLHLETVSSRRGIPFN